MSTTVTVDELVEILGLEDDEARDLFKGDEIQVCAGTWKRVDARIWTFIPDEDQITW